MPLRCRLFGHSPREFSVDERMRVAGLGYGLGEALNSASRICDRCHTVLGTAKDSEINLALRRGVPPRAPPGAVGSRGPEPQPNAANNPFTPNPRGERSDPSTIFTREGD